MAKVSVDGNEVGNNRDATPSSHPPCKRTRTTGTKPNASPPISKSPVKRCTTQRSASQKCQNATTKASKDRQSASRSEDDSEQQPASADKSDSGHEPEGQSEEEHELAEEVQAEDDESLTETPSITIDDPDVLDCPICNELLAPPVFQCDRGHWACGSCCTNIRNICPSCNLPIGYLRCRAFEKVLESVKISCQNMRYGCMEKISCLEKLDHETKCKFAPCPCPLLDCDYVGMSTCLYKHFAQEHKSSVTQFRFNNAFDVKVNKDAKHTFLQEKFGNTLFVLNSCTEPTGSLVNVAFVAPDSSKKKFWYELKSTAGESSIEMKSRAEPMLQFMEQPPLENYMTVPSYYVMKDGCFTMGVIIRKKPW